MRIGQVDPRFGLGRAELDRVLAEAIQLWEQPTGQDWLVQDAQASLTVNLIYDQRQQLSDQSARQAWLLDQQKAQTDQLFAQYQQQQAALEHCAWLPEALAHETAEQGGTGASGMLIGSQWPNLDQALVDPVAEVAAAALPCSRSRLPRPR